MKAEELYDGITQLEDELIREGEPARRGTNRRPRRWLPAAAAAACVALCAVLWGGQQVGDDMALADTNQSSAPESAESNGNAEDASTVWQHYAGPILPLDVLEGVGITAQREVTLDVSGLQLAVEDRYALTASEDRTATLVYPFVSSLGELEEALPTLTVSGQQIETQLYAGAYAGGYQAASADDGALLNLLQPRSWEDVERQLSDENYRQAALEPEALPETPVVVYRFAGAARPDSLPAGSVGVDVTPGEGSVLLTYGFSGYRSDDDGSVRYSYSIRHDGLRALAVLGEDVSLNAVKGYPDGGCEDGEETDAITLPGVTREETTLGAFLREAAQSWSDTEQGALLLQSAVQLLDDFGPLAEQPVGRYEIGRLEELFSDARAQLRVFYLTAQVELTAGQPLEAAFTFEKEADYDYIPQNGQRRGYELATQLGSSLCFSGQWATLTGWEAATLTDQSFGFDPENGVTRVALTDEVYKMEIQK